MSRQYPGQPSRATHTAASRSPARSVRSLPRKQRNFTIVTFSVGMLLLLFHTILLTSDRDVSTAHLLIVLFLFGCIASAPGVRVKRGLYHWEYRIWEFPVLVSLTLAPVYVVAAAMIVTYGALCLRAYVRYPGQRHWIPADFGIVAIASSVGIPIAASNPLLTFPIGYMVAVLVVEVGLHLHNLTLGDRAYALGALREDLSKRLGTPLVVSVVITAMIYILGPSREFLMVLPVTALGIYAAMVWRNRRVDQHTGWQKMESISSKFIGELDEHNAIRIALEESLNLFSADRAEIVLPGDATDAGARWELAAGPGTKMTFDALPPSQSKPQPPKPTFHSQVIRLIAAERNFGYMVIEWDPRSPDNVTRETLTATFGHAVAAAIANTRYNRQRDQHAAEKAREAETDPLTGLGNRTMLSSQGPVRLSEAKDIHRKCALLLFDLDGFKRINDTLGHAAGDQVLIEVAERIRKNIRRNDIAIRLGGDEFAILATDMTMAADAEVLVGKITRALVPAIDVADLQLSVEASIGVAMYPDDAEDIETLLKLADIAMYEAKAHGRGTMIRYSPQINLHTTESLTLTTDLRRALYATDELVLHYQPQVDLQTGKVNGLEALVRWNHPRLGMLYPDRFVHIAERSNLIRPFTLHIVEQAIADRALIREVIPEGTVSVNLSAQNLLDTALSGAIADLLAKYQVAPQELVLEVTETATAKDVLAADRVLQELSSLGCAIAMDDFGTGYATMESLRSGSPINEIKIDRGFIRDIGSNVRDRKVAHAIIEIAHAWGCRVVAEGVEDQESYTMLRKMGCDDAQGYWIHKPGPLGTILDWIRDHSGALLSR